MEVMDVSVPRHEHLYTAMASKLIISDELKGADIERLSGGSRIMLSTLSMLSNPVLHSGGMFLTVPVERLVMDEASQIKVGDLMVRITSRLNLAESHGSVKFFKTLREVVFLEIQSNFRRSFRFRLVSSTHKLTCGFLPVAPHGQGIC